MRALVVRCPEWDDDEIFEPVVAAIEAHAAGVEILRPGLVALPANGPASYYGTEEAAAERIVDEVAEASGAECMVGIADGLFAAYLAAHHGTIVPNGMTVKYLADIDISAIGRPELISVLRRLGIYTLGGFAALSAVDVAERFGADAVIAHRLAGGGDTRPPVPRVRPPDLDVAIDCDPPLDRIDVAAFTARALAAQQHRLLAAHRLSCSQLVITATTCDGVTMSRTWRHDGVLSSDAVADRVRWQLDGWLTGKTPRPTSGIAMLVLTPEGLMPAAETQPSLWGETSSSQLRADRALVHVQGLLGAAAVTTAVDDGGRNLANRVRLVPWGEPRLALRPTARPWPGAPPSPAPSKVPLVRDPADVRDADGKPVGVTGRHVLTHTPATVECGGYEPAAVAAWAGPWPVMEHWWRPGSQRYARLQVCLRDDRAFLLSIEHGQWTVEGYYD